MSAWQIFRPHRWARRSDAEKSVRFREVLAAIQSALRTERSAHGRNARLAETQMVVNLPGKAANGGAQAPDM
ncbi:hypothetical protein PY365_33960 [Roseiarcaceae bacterium H3SJ34-1]|uniref:hypothetical protein n=1 Tax=Terripilifer ovatus TaxID=3032367 RepID=UPI003AB99760|nr:hypothetical protein [Roseiarcaceae bacterium H3SJ34-1]